MNSPAIINPTIAAPTMAPPVKRSETAQPDSSFNQVLKREIADRGNADKENAARPQETSNANTPQPASGKPAQKADAKEKSEADKAENLEKTETTDSSASVPSEMLALFANVGQIAIAPEPRDAAVASVDLKDLKPVSDAKLAAASAASADVATETDIPAGKVEDAASAFDTELAIASDNSGKGAQPELKNSADNAQAGAKKLREFAAADSRTVPSADGEAKPAPDRNIAIPTGSSQNQANVTGAAAEIRAAADAKTAAGLPDAQALQEIVATAPAQQTAVAHGLQAIAAQASDRITPHVGTPGWDRALAQKVVWMVAGDQQNASLTLNPPDLGPLQVVLNVTNSQATVTFSAAQPEVRQALESAMPKLREMMGEAGIQLGQATVGSGNPNQNDNSGERSHSARFGDPINEIKETVVQVPRSRGISSGQGLVDTFV